MPAKPENQLQLVEEIPDLEIRASLPLSTAKELRVTSDVELEQAGRLVVILKDLQNEVKELLDPVVHAAEDARRSRLKPFQDAEKLVRDKMNDFVRAREAERAKAKEERRKVEEHLRQQPATQAPEKFSAPLVVTPPLRLPEVPPEPKAAGVSEVQDWRWRIVDLSLIPAEFWILDEKSLDAHVRLNKEAKKIPGVEVFPESRVVVKR